MKISLDFDGVINSYESGWTGDHAVVDPPVAGAADALRKYLDAGCTLFIHSCRAATPKGRSAIAVFIQSMGIDPDDITITIEKPRADVYIDDRGFRFEGTFPSVEKLQTLVTPWNRKQ